MKLEHIRKVYKGGFMGLVKRKKDVIAIEDLSFSVPKVSFEFLMDIIGGS